MQCKGDAGVSIVKSGIGFAKVGRNVVAVAEDTDLLIFLMYHWKLRMEELIFGTERKEKKKSKWFYWNVCDLVAAQSCPKTLLFAHVWTGCDTTSAIHQKGKFCY